MAAAALAPARDAHKDATRARSAANPASGWAGDPSNNVCECAPGFSFCAAEYAAGDRFDCTTDVLALDDDTAIARAGRILIRDSNSIRCSAGYQLAPQRSSCSLPSSARPFAIGVHFTAPCQKTTPGVHHDFDQRGVDFQHVCHLFLGGGPIEQMNHSVTPSVVTRNHHYCTTTCANCPNFARRRLTACCAHHWPIGHKGRPLFHSKRLKMQWSILSGLTRSPPRRQVTSRRMRALRDGRILRLDVSSLSILACRPAQDACDLPEP